MNPQNEKLSLKSALAVLILAGVAPLAAQADSCTYKVDQNESYVKVRADHISTDQWGDLQVPKGALPLKDKMSIQWADGRNQFRITYKKGVLEYKEDTIDGEHFTARVTTNPELTSFESFSQKVRYLFFRSTNVDCSK